MKAFLAIRLVKLFISLNIKLIRVTLLLMPAVTAQYGIDLRQGLLAYLNHKLGKVSQDIYFEDQKARKRTGQANGQVLGDAQFNSARNKAEAEMRVLSQALVDPKTQFFIKGQKNRDPYVLVANPKLDQTSLITATEKQQRSQARPVSRGTLHRVTKMQKLKNKMGIFGSMAANADPHLAKYIKQDFEEQKFEPDIAA